MGTFDSTRREEEQRTGPQEAWDGAGRLTDERPPGIMVSLRFGPKLTVPWKKKNDNTGEASREKEPVPKQGNKDPPPDSPLASDVAGFPVGMAMAHYNSLLSLFFFLQSIKFFFWTSRRCVIP